MYYCINLKLRITAKFDDVTRTYVTKLYYKDQIQFFYTLSHNRPIIIYLQFSKTTKTRFSTPSNTIDIMFSEL